MNRSLEIDGAVYPIEVIKNINRPPEAPRLVVVSFLPNETAAGILKACIRAVRHFTTIPYELWVIDNLSPDGNAEFLRDIPDINVVFNRKSPSPEHKHTLIQRLVNRFRMRGQTGRWGSYANGVALEIGARCIDPESQFMMTLHMDTMPCRPGWLAFLCSKLDKRTKAAGVRLDNQRVKDGILHVLGYLFYFPLYRELGFSFLPQLPDYDVGDKLIVDLKQAGYAIFACRNTLWDSSLVDLIPESSPLHQLAVDRSFDDLNHVIFLHLGRGVIKSSSGELDIVDQWLKLAETYE